MRSLGLLELIIIGIVTILILLVSAVIIEVLRKKQRGGASPAPTRHWIWIVLVVLVALAVIAIIVAGLGVLSIIPVRQEISGENTFQIVVVEEDDQITSSIEVETPALVRTPESEPMPTETRSGSFYLFDPARLTWLPSLLALAAVVTLVSAALTMPILLHWHKTTLAKNALENPISPPVMTPGNLGYWMQWCVFWLALSLLLILDFSFSVTLHLRVLILFCAFWLLVGVLLLPGKPLREKILILSLMVILLFSIRFIDWNSRKAFLRDFDRIAQGMTAEQVDSIMGNYILNPDEQMDNPEHGVNSDGSIINGAISYRHTDAGWGDSDVGIITFENNLVSATQFLPD